MHRLFLLTVSLIAILMVGSCAPAATAAPVSVPTGTVIIPATETLAATPLSPTQAVEVQAVATSRGPNLEATDPASVILASGQLQLIEFFRFT